MYEWLTGVAPPSPPSSSPTIKLHPEGLPARIGPFVITRKIGQGGMGIVYAARDERRQRTVALKTIASPVSDDAARKRFWREARAAASLNHPNVVQIHEIGEDAGTLFIAMELLEGETLADRLKKGSLSVSEMMPVGLGILAALSALHAQGLIHRDLKPSNVFLTRHGVKLLDFGLARQELEPSLGSTAGLTQTGVSVGTPQYMAPEQVTGDTVDARCDLFAAGAILFEMLAGRPAFRGRTVIDVLHATLHEQPPALTGPPAVAAVDRVIRQALAKHPSARPISAEAMAEELRDAAGDVDGDDSRALARPLTRLVVLPFRVLRADPETDFLAFSLPDAIATSLSRVGSIVVRSSAAAARFGGDSPDLQALASHADVDRVVMGTLLRSGGELRATAQLVEAPGGTLIASHTIQSSLGDLFGLQDDISRRVVEALSLPLAGITPPTPEVPRSAKAYEFYLRANEISRTYDGVERGRDLYLQSLELDPGFAPAWAQLGRCHRIINKYIDGTGDIEERAQAAFRQALTLDPHLSVAHKFFAQLEADMGQARQGIVRLLAEAKRHGNDPALFAGLVHTCRYCGLNEEAVAAHAEARRLDPNVATSLEGTLLMMGDVDRLLAVERSPIDPGADEGIRVMGLGLAGRREEARAALVAMAGKVRIPAFKWWTDILMAWIEGRAADMLGGFPAIGGLAIQLDPEAQFIEGWLLCDIGAYDAGLDYLRRAVAKGYCAAPTLRASRAFDALRGNPAFEAVLAEADAGRQQALDAFREADGDRLLGR